MSGRPTLENLTQKILIKETKMTPYYQDEYITICQGDCLDVLPEISGITAVVTDPPYGLSFMGKDWDHGSPGQHFWELIKDACLPGAPLLSFGGTRTYHRLTVAIEDAGWEIRDCLMWIYGSGFPKSLDVGKAIDKAAGVEREVIERRKYRDIRNGHGRSYGEGINASARDAPEYLEHAITAPATPAAQLWDGYGTSLKPAYEPVVLARKPLEGTVAQNVQKYGTGALWIDGGRVGTETLHNAAAGNKPGGNSLNMSKVGMPQDVEGRTVTGRWPSNLIHDGSDEVVGLFPHTGKSTGGKGETSALVDNAAIYGKYSGLNKGANAGGLGDSGSAARFFYCAKASKSERNAGVNLPPSGGEYRPNDDPNENSIRTRLHGREGTGNTHATVKPLALMRYLLTLVTMPENNVILDPFMGSGSTLVAAKELGLHAIGIEKDAHSCEIAAQRVRHATAPETIPEEIAPEITKEENTVTTTQSETPTPETTTGTTAYEPTLTIDNLTGPERDRAESQPLWRANRVCHACHLREGCAGAVPGDGLPTARIMLIGEAPGKKEDETAFPFQGQAGMVLKSLQERIGLTDESVYITNIVKCRPPGNRNPSQEEIDTCTTLWLQKEIEMVKPSIVVTMGKFASQYILGTDETMDHLHGQPILNVSVPVSDAEAIRDMNDEIVMTKPDYVIPIVYPVYHPAAGLHNTPLFRQIYNDFEGLGLLARGGSPSDLIVTDDYPSPDYQELTTVEEVREYIWKDVPGNIIGMDTEYISDDNSPEPSVLVSVQLSRAPGEGRYITAELWQRYVDTQELERKTSISKLLGHGEQEPLIWPADVTVALHNYIADAEVLGWADNPSIAPPRYTDTMVMAYLLGEPLSLKTLARDLCGIDMQAFTDLVRPYQYDLSLDYVKKLIASAEVAAPPKRGMFKGKGSKKLHEQAMEGYTKYLETAVKPFPDPPELTETKWNNAKGHLEEKTKRPLKLISKLNKIIKDIDSGKEVDIHHRLMSWDPLELTDAVLRCGPPPQVNITHVPMEQQLPYASRDADATVRVAQKLTADIEFYNLQSVLEEQDIPMLDIALEMMKNGIAVDVDHFRKLSEEFTEKMSDEALKAAKVAGGLCYYNHAGAEIIPEEDVDPYTFNPNSSPQCVKLFFDDLALPPIQFSKDTNLPSTDNRTLRLLVAAHPEISDLVDHIISYRQLLKLKTTYADKIPKWARPETSSESLLTIVVGDSYTRQYDKDGPVVHYRVHARYRTVNTETGRLSAADPNVMAIPVRTTDGKRIREGFITGPDDSTFGPKTLLFIDYSQVEMRVLMHISNCEAGIRLFRDDRDIHTETAAAVYGVSLEEASKDPMMRRVAKIMNFGISYGLSVHGLHGGLIEAGIEGWDIPSCEQFISDYFNLYPEIKIFQQETAAFARRNGYVQDMWGRRRWVPEFLTPVRSIQSAGERQAFNMPVQAGAQGIIKKAARDIWNSFPQWRPYIQWLLQIHDELGWETFEVMVQSIARDFAAAMEATTTLKVPLKATIKTGKNWGSLEE